VAFLEGGNLVIFKVFLVHMKSGLIRGLGFCESGLIRWGLLYNHKLPFFA
jgi:hypothetical protein